MRNAKCEIPGRKEMEKAREILHGFFFDFEGGKKEKKKKGKVNKALILSFWYALTVTVCECVWMVSGVPRCEGVLSSSASIIRSRNTCYENFR